MGKKEKEIITKIKNKKKEEWPYELDILLKTYNNKNNRRIIKILKDVPDGHEVEYDADKILEELNKVIDIEEKLNEDDKKDKNKHIKKSTIYQYLRELEEAKLVFREEYSNDIYKPKKIYFIGENQKKRIDKIDEILTKPIEELTVSDKAELKIIIGLLDEDEIMEISEKFMKRVQKGEWMDICFPAESVRFVIELKVYRNGYKKMKERGIKIRVITEFTADNMEFCLKMIKEKMVDEIRHLKNIKCGFAVSKKQYMAAFLYENKSNTSKIMTNVAYSGDKKMIKYGQSLFDTCWENAIPMLNNSVR